MSFSFHVLRPSRLVPLSTRLPPLLHSPLTSFQPQLLSPIQEECNNNSLPISPSPYPIIPAVASVATVKTSQTGQLLPLLVWCFASSFTFVLASIYYYQDNNLACTDHYSQKTPIVYGLAVEVVLERFVISPLFARSRLAVRRYHFALCAAKLISWLCAVVWGWEVHIWIGEALSDYHTWIKTLFLGGWLFVAHRDAWWSVLALLAVWLWWQNVTGSSHHNRDSLSPSKSWSGHS